MPRSRFETEVTAVDKSAGGLASFGRNLAKLDAPIAKTNKSLADVASRSRFDEIGKSFEAIGGKVRGVADAVTGMLPGMGALAGLSSIAGVMNLATDFANRGVNIRRQSALLGLDEKEIQRARGAAELGKLQGQDFDAAFEGLDDALNQIQNGQNNIGALLLNTLKVRIPRRGEIIDTRKYMDEIADRLPSLVPVDQRKVAGQLGFSQMLAIMREGSGKMRALEAEYDRTHAGMGKDGIDKANALGDSYAKVGVAAQGAGNKIAADLTPALLGLNNALIWLLDASNAPLGSSFNKKFGFLMSDKAPVPGTPAETTRAPVVTPHIRDPYPDKTIGQLTWSEFAAISQQQRVSVSGPDGVVHIKLQVEAAPGLRARVITQTPVGAKIETAMPNDGS